MVLSYFLKLTFPVVVDVVTEDPCMVVVFCDSEVVDCVFVVIVLPCPVENWVIVDGEEVVNASVVVEVVVEEVVDASVVPASPVVILPVVISPEVKTTPVVDFPVVTC